MTTGLQLCQKYQRHRNHTSAESLVKLKIPSSLYLITAVCSLSVTFLQWKPLGFSQLERHTKMVPIQTDCNPFNTQQTYLPTASSNFKGTILFKRNLWAYNSEDGIAKSSLAYQSNTFNRDSVTALVSLFLMPQRSQLGKWGDCWASTLPIIPGKQGRTDQSQCAVHPAFLS